MITASFLRPGKETVRYFPARKRVAGGKCVCLSSSEILARSEYSLLVTLIARCLLMNKSQTTQQWARVVSSSAGDLSHINTFMQSWVWDAAAPPAAAAATLGDHTAR